MASLAEMTNPPLWIENGSYSADDFRGLIDAIAYQGVAGSGDLAVGPRGAGANLSVDVAAGAAVVNGDSPAGTLSYLCRSDAIQNLDIGAAPGSGSRIDLIIATVRDSAVGGGSDDDWVLQVIAGTSGTSPSPPSLPNNSIELGRVTIVHGQASVTAGMIADKRQSMHRVAVATSTTKPAVARNGQLATHSDEPRVFIGQANEWVDIGLGGIDVVYSGNTVFGPTVADPSTVRWKRIVSRQSISFLSGAGTLALPFTFTAIQHISITPIANTQGIVVCRATSFGTLDGDSIPLTAFSTTDTAFGGSLDCTYEVFGR